MKPVRAIQKIIASTLVCTFIFSNSVSYPVPSNFSFTFGDGKPSFLATNPAKMVDAIRAELRKFAESFGGGVRSELRADTLTFQLSGGENREMITTRETALSSVLARLFGRSAVWIERYVEKQRIKIQIPLRNSGVVSLAIGISDFGSSLNHFTFNHLHELFPGTTREASDTQVLNLIDYSKPFLIERPVFPPLDQSLIERLGSALARNAKGHVHLVGGYAIVAVRPTELQEKPWKMEGAQLKIDAFFLESLQKPELIGFRVSSRVSPFDVAAREIQQGTEDPAAVRLIDAWRQATGRSELHDLDKTNKLNRSETQSSNGISRAELHDLDKTNKLNRSETQSSNGISRAELRAKKSDDGERVLRKEVEAVYEAKAPARQIHSYYEDGKTFLEINDQTYEVSDAKQAILILSEHGVSAQINEAASYPDHTVIDYTLNGTTKSLEVRGNSRAELREIAPVRYAKDPKEALVIMRGSYQTPDSSGQAYTDEFMPPIIVGDPKDGQIGPDDAAIFYNFRNDRMREPVAAVLDTDISDGGSFKGFPLSSDFHPHVVMMTPYHSAFRRKASHVVDPILFNHTMFDVMSEHGVSVLRVAESEKKPHVTHFMDGQRDVQRENEEIFIVPSPKEVGTYDQKPEMSAEATTDRVVKSLQSHEHNFTFINYANTDMVGHTGNFEAAKRAAEFVDTQIGRVLEEAKKQNALVVITSDHGNAEEMVDEKGRPHTKHTLNPVHFMIYDPSGQINSQTASLRDIDPDVKKSAKLSDVWPTLAQIFGWKLPEREPADYPKGYPEEYKGLSGSLLTKFDSRLQVDLKKRPVVMILTDGWGLGPTVGPRATTNAIFQAYTPNISHLWNDPNVVKTRLYTHGPYVGLPEGIQGGSEIGHKNLGLEVVATSEISEIFRQIKTHELFHNKALIDAMEHVRKTHGKLHLIGLLSDGGVHSHQDQLYALMQMAKSRNVPVVVNHVITDGRDTAPTSGAGEYLPALMAETDKLNQQFFGGTKFVIGDVMGRYWAMDRDRRWGRVELAYNVWTRRSGINLGLPVVKRAHAMGILDSRGNPTVRAYIQFSDGFEAEGLVPSGASTGEREAIELRDGDYVKAVRARKREFTDDMADKIFTSDEIEQEKTRASNGGKPIDNIEAALRLLYQDGKDVRVAIYFANHILLPRLLEEVRKGNVSLTDQVGVDNFLKELEKKAGGDPERKTFYGANAILAVSIAALRAGAHLLMLEPFEHIAEKGSATDFKPVVIQGNVLNGGVHGDNNVDFQETMLTRFGRRAIEDIREMTPIFHELKGVLKEKGYSTNVGDEGGFAPSVKGGNSEYSTLLEQAAKKSLKARNRDENEWGRSLGISMDNAASELVLRNDDEEETPILTADGEFQYRFEGEVGETLQHTGLRPIVSLVPALINIGTVDNPKLLGRIDKAKDKKGKLQDILILTSSELVQYYLALMKVYPIVSIEDPFDQNDFAGYLALTQKANDSAFVVSLPFEVQRKEGVDVVGDDLPVTQLRILKAAVEGGEINFGGKLLKFEPHTINSILIKINQVGTVTDALDTIRWALSHGVSVKISHRSGETEDAIIADIAKAVTHQGKFPRKAHPVSGQVPKIWIKTGSFSRSDRNAKYNRLLEIEHYLELPASERAELHDLDKTNKLNRGETQSSNGISRAELHDLDKTNKLNRGETQSSNGISRAELRAETAKGQKKAPKIGMRGGFQVYAAGIAKSPAKLYGVSRAVFGLPKDRESSTRFNRTKQAVLQFVPAGIVSAVAAAFKYAGASVYDEEYAVIQKNIRRSLDMGLEDIVLNVGETPLSRKDERQFEVVTNQLATALMGVTADEMKQITITYQSRATVTTADILSMGEHIQNQVKGLKPNMAGPIKISVFIDGTGLNFQKVKSMVDVAVAEYVKSGIEEKLKILVQIGEFDAVDLVAFNNLNEYSNKNVEIGIIPPVEHLQEVAKISARPAMPEKSLATEYPDTPLGKILAKWVFNSKIPKESLDEAENRILDSLAIATRAKNYQLARTRFIQALELAHEEEEVKGSAAYATLFFSKYKVPLDKAMLLLGAAIRDLDFDDTILGQEPGHPSDNIAALLLLGEALGKSGKEILESTVVAYEIQIRFAEALKIRDNGWDHVIYIAIATAMGAGKLLGLNEEQLENVAARAAAKAGGFVRGVRQGKLTDQKSGNASEAAEIGLKAALDVRDGLQADEAFEKALTFNDQYLDGLDFKRWVKPFDGKAISLSFYKRRQAEYHTQSVIELTSDLSDQIAAAYGRNEDGTLSDAALEAIQHIDLYTFEAVITILADKDPIPLDRETFDHHMAALIAATVVYGDIDEHVYHNALNDPRVHRLSKMIHENMHEDSEYTKAYYDEARRHNHNRVVIQLRKPGGGIETLDKDLENASGHWSRPWGIKEVSEKVHKLIDPVYGREKVDQMIVMVKGMQTDANFSVTKLLHLFADPNEEDLLTETKPVVSTDQVYKMLLAWADSRKSRQNEENRRLSLNDSGRGELSESLFSQRPRDRGAMIGYREMVEAVERFNNEFPNSKFLEEVPDQPYRTYRLVSVPQKKTYGPNVNVIYGNIMDERSDAIVVGVGTRRGTLHFSGVAGDVVRAIEETQKFQNLLYPTGAYGVQSDTRPGNSFDAARIAFPYVADFNGYEEEKIEPGDVTSPNPSLRTDSFETKAGWNLVISAHIFEDNARNATPEVIGKAVTRALEVADLFQLTSISIPALGTGAARLSADDSADAILKAVHAFLETNPQHLKLIKIVSNSPRELSAFHRIAGEVFNGVLAKRRPAPPAEKPAKEAGGIDTGLRGQVVGTQHLAEVTQTGLAYRGYAIEELGMHATFEEVVHLLLFGELPTQTQLDELNRKLQSYRKLPGEVVQLLQLIPKDTPMMDVLRSAVSMFGHFDPFKGQDNYDSDRERALQLLAAVPVMIAVRTRILQGQEPFVIEPKPELSHAANILYMATGQVPSREVVRLLDMTLIMYAEHDFNASTFAARVTASTLSDIFSSIVTGIGTLKGPLHGGANEAAADILKKFEDKSVGDARKWVYEMFKTKGLIMGFGHAVYKEGDHRAIMVDAYVRQLAKKMTEAGDKRAAHLLQVYDEIKDIMIKEKGMYPNLDYPVALLYLLLGFDKDSYTPLFVASRVSGWTAHYLEQAYKKGTDQPRSTTIYRPGSQYVGPARGRKVVPIAERSGRAELRSIVNRIELLTPRRPDRTAPTVIADVQHALTSEGQSRPQEYGTRIPHQTRSGHDSDLVASTVRTFLETFPEKSIDPMYLFILFDALMSKGNLSTAGQLKLLREIVMVLASDKLKAQIVSDYQPQLFLIARDVLAKLIERIKLGRISEDTNTVKEIMRLLATLLNEENRAKIFEIVSKNGAVQTVLGELGFASAPRSELRATTHKNLRIERERLTAELNGLRWEISKINKKLGTPTSDYAELDERSTLRAIGTLKDLRIKRIERRLGQIDKILSRAELRIGKAINSDFAPKAVGAYPHARQYQDHLFLSGVGPRKLGSDQIPGVVLNSGTGQVMSRDIEAQMRSTFANVGFVLEAAGVTWKEITEMEIFLTHYNEEERETFERVWTEHFKQVGHEPAFKIIEVDALPTPIAFEVNAIAKISSAPPADLVVLENVGPENREGQVTAKGIKDQVEATLENIRRRLEEAGSSWENILAVRVSLANMKEDFPAYNSIWKATFPPESDQPARTTVSVDTLPPGVHIHVKVIAAKSRAELRAEYGEYDEKVHTAFGEVGKFIDKYLVKTSKSEITNAERSTILPHFELVLDEIPAQTPHEMLDILHRKIYSGSFSPAQDGELLKKASVQFKDLLSSRAELRAEAGLPQNAAVQSSKIVELEGGKTVPRTLVGKITSALLELNEGGNFEALIGLRALADDVSYPMKDTAVIHTLQTKELVKPLFEPKTGALKQVIFPDENVREIVRLALLIRGLDVFVRSPIKGQYPRQIVKLAQRRTELRSTKEMRFGPKSLTAQQILEDPLVQDLILRLSVFGPKSVETKIEDSVLVLTITHQEFVPLEMQGLIQKVANDVIAELGIHISISHQPDNLEESQPNVASPGEPRSELHSQPLFNNVAKNTAPTLNDLTQPSLKSELHSARWLSTASASTSKSELREAFESLRPELAAPARELELLDQAIENLKRQSVQKVNPPRFRSELRKGNVISSRVEPALVGGTVVQVIGPNLAEKIMSEGRETTEALKQTGIQSFILFTGRAELRAFRSIVGAPPANVVLLDASDPDEVARQLRFYQPTEMDSIGFEGTSDRAILTRLAETLKIFARFRAVRSVGEFLSLLGELVQKIAIDITGALMRAAAA